MIDTATLVAAALIGAYAVGVLLSTVRERLALAAFVRAIARWAERPTESSPDEAISGLPGDYHLAATRLTDGLRGTADLDESMQAAVVAMAELPLRPAAAFGVLIDVALALLVALPGLGPCLGAAAELAEAWASPERGPARYAADVALAERSFGGLADGFAASAALAVALSLVFALRWWLSRPEAREARMLETLLRAALVARPQLRAPGTAALARRAAPSLGWRPALGPTLAFVVAAGLAWLVLVSTSELRAANARPLRFDLWPEQRAAAPDSVRTFLPSHAAGRPLESRAAVTLIVDETSAVLAQRPVLRLDEGALPVGWAERVRSAAPSALARFRDGEAAPDVIVLGHRDVPGGTVLGLARALSRAGSGVLHLTLERRISGATGARAVQASLRLRARRADESIAPPIALRVERNTVRVEARAGRALELSLSEASWAREVAAQVRAATGIHPAVSPADPRVGLEVGEGVSYDKLTAVLAAADAACPADATEDCGLPGLGLEFLLGG